MSAVSFPTVGKSRFAGDNFDRAFYGASERDGVVRSAQKKGPVSAAMRAAQKQCGRFAYSNEDWPQLSDVAEGECDE
ncbi:hypothetical protein [Burkholderia diffusa]|uniref:hypothetical protein n=1 Tax=Burkholderia diffusa TaxID=488732 RepID=UPI002ABDB027|nr:hypothetical protein [Burkholderia diffusa]